MGTDGQGPVVEPTVGPASTPSPTALLGHVRETRTRLGDRVEELVQVLRRPEWASDLTMQMDTVRVLRLGQLGSAAGSSPLPEESWIRLNREARLAFSRIPHQSALRWDRLLQLPNEEDVARALRYVPKPTDRFPGEEVYPTDGWLGTYLRWCHAGEVPLAFHFWAAVAIMGACCHRNIFLDRGSFYLYPAHSVWFIGPPGIRKTQAISTAAGLLQTTNDLLEAGWSERLRTHPGEMYTCDPRVRLLPHDASFLHILKTLRGTTEVWVGDEKLTLIGPQDACGFMGLDELGTLLSKDGFAVGKTIDTLIALCDAPGQHRYSTERQGLIVLNNVALTFLAATTPNWIRENLTARMFLGGLSSRLLFIYRLDAAGRRFATPAPLDPIAKLELARWLGQLCQRPKTAMELTPEANLAFEEWYERNHQHVENPRLDERLSGYYRRKDGHVLRLAMILALAYDEAPWITPERFAQAVQLLDHEEQMMVECFTEVGRHPDAPALNLILGTLQRFGGELTYSDWLRRCYHYDSVGKRFPEFVDVLVAMGKVELVAPGAMARHNAARKYRLAPTPTGPIAPGG